MSGDSRALRSNDNNIPMLDNQPTNSKIQTPESFRYKPPLLENHSTPNKYLNSLPNGGNEITDRLSNDETPKRNITSFAKQRISWMAIRSKGTPRTPRVRKFVENFRTKKQSEAELRELQLQVRQELQQTTISTVQTQLGDNDDKNDANNDNNDSQKDDTNIRLSSIHRSPSSRTITVAMGTPRSARRRVRSFGRARRSTGTGRKSIGRNTGSLIFSGTEFSKTVLMDGDDLIEHYPSFQNVESDIEPGSIIHDDWEDEEVTGPTTKRFSPRDELRALSRIIVGEKRRRKRLEEIKQRQIDENQKEESNPKNQNRSHRSSIFSVKELENGLESSTASNSRKRNLDSNSIFDVSPKKSRNHSSLTRKESLESQAFRNRLSNSFRLSPQQLTSQNIDEAELMATPTPSISSDSFRKSKKSNESVILIHDESPPQSQDKHTGLDMNSELEIQRDAQFRLSTGKPRVSETFSEFNMTQIYDGADTSTKSFGIGHISTEFIKPQQSSYRKSDTITDFFSNTSQRKNSEKFVIEFDENFVVPDDIDLDVTENESLSFDSPFGTASKSKKSNSTNRKSSSIQDLVIESDQSIEDDSTQDFSEREKQLKDRMIYETQNDDGVDLHVVGEADYEAEEYRHLDLVSDEETMIKDLDLNLDDIITENEYSNALNNGDEKLLEDMLYHQDDDPGINKVLHASLPKTIGELNNTQPLNQKPTNRIGTKITQQNRRKAPPCVIPQSVIKDLASSMIKSKRKLEPSAVHRIMEITNVFFDQIGEDLGTYARHAKRKRVEVSDVLLMMNRQRSLLASRNFNDKSRVSNISLDRNENHKLLRNNRPENGPTVERPWQSGRSIQQTLQKERREKEKEAEFLLDKYNENTFIENFALKYLPQESLDEIADALASHEASPKRKGRRINVKASFKTSHGTADTPKSANDDEETFWENEED